MLKLTRNTNQPFIIGDNIKVTVLGDAHGQVKRGIEAPDDVEICREEIYKFKTVVEINYLRK